MLRNIILRGPLNLTAAICRRHLQSSSPPSSLFFFSSDSTVTQLTRLPSLLEGCDYKHWLVVMEAPKGYPPRDEIVNGYVKTLASALGCEEDAKKSIYSVSTKYYYAFGCKVPEDFAYKIRCNIVTFFHQVYLSLIVVFSLKWRLIKPFIGLQPYQM
ncbi:multiple organellar RNA editing factor 7 [Citrus sinensis]|uniref:Multiple organellar RNA editing factor 7 n=1 Tax=Citrus sinensis TaxID=2711 RepID=A0ACB8J7Q9_CITSI|nr:multiple organellar RNA editing factor 7 [Citrus sinensis]